LVDLRHLRDLRRVAAVMRQGMVRLADADLGIGAVARLARELKRDDARDVRLEGERLEVDHELRVIDVRCGHAARAIEVDIRELRRFRLGLLDPALHLADRLEVLADLRAVRGPERAFEPREIIADGIEHAPSPRERRATLLIRLAVAEKSLEDDAGM